MPPLKVTSSCHSSAREAFQAEYDFSCSVAKMPFDRHGELKLHNAQAGGVRQINLPCIRREEYAGVDSLRQRAVQRVERATTSCRSMIFRETGGLAKDGPPVRWRLHQFPCNQVFLHQTHCRENLLRLCF